MIHSSKQINQQGPAEILECHLRWKEREPRGSLLQVDGERRLYAPGPLSWLQQKSSRGARGVTAAKARTGSQNRASLSS